MFKKGLKNSLIIIVSSSIYFSCSDLKEDYNIVTYHNPIKIGFIAPFSENRIASENEYLGIFLAAEEINAAGGVNGRDIQIIARNDGGSASIGVDAAKQLYNEGIKIILGPDWSSITLAVAREVTIPNQMLLMSFSSTNPSISNLDDNDLVWRTCPSDVFQGRIGADYCKTYLKKNSAAILALNNSYSLELAKAFQDNFIKLGGTITHFGTYPELTGEEITKYDYSKHLDSVFVNKPEVFYLASYPTDGAKITNDIAKNNYITPSYQPFFFSNDGLYSNYFLVNGHINIKEKFYGTAPGTAKSNVNYSAYSNNYIKRWGFEPTAYTEYAYDALYLIAYAIAANNGKDNPLEIAPYLREISGNGVSPSASEVNVNEYKKAEAILLSGGNIDYNGASGSIEFDSNGDPGSASYIIWNINDGKFVSDTIVTIP